MQWPLHTVTLRNARSLKPGTLATCERVVENYGEYLYADTLIQHLPFA